VNVTCAICGQSSEQYFITSTDRGLELHPDLAPVYSAEERYARAGDRGRHTVDEAYTDEVPGNAMKAHAVQQVSRGIPQGLRRTRPRRRRSPRHDRAGRQDRDRAEARATPARAAQRDTAAPVTTRYQHRKHGGADMMIDWQRMDGITLAEATERLARFAGLMPAGSEGR
jgi:hypothetical protein